MDGVEMIKRENFESMVLDNFRIKNLELNHRGEYQEPEIEDHWQTFQEGWDFAISFIRNRTNPQYTDIKSDGKRDPR
jgi:hypothetical protein